MVILTKSDVVTKLSVLITAGGSDCIIKAVTLVATTVNYLTGTSASVIGFSVVVMTQEVGLTGMYSWDPQIG